MAESTSLNAASASIPPPSNQPTVASSGEKTSSSRPASSSSSANSVPLSPGAKKGKRRNPSGSSATNHVDNDLTTRLLQSLSTQLEYYFSKQNLDRDTYLRTIMNLNSGYVPTTVLATFAKVNLLLNRYDTNHQALDRYGDVPGLVKEAASRSKLLEVVVVNSEGKVVDREQNDKGGAEKPIEQKSQGQGETDDAAADKANSGGVRLVAVGLKQGATIPVAVPAEAATQITTPPRVPSPPADAGANAGENGASVQQTTEKNTVILRDMPDGTTEDDVRSIFSSLDKAPGIHSIHSDVGNCWFVSLEPTPKDELVNLLMALRNKKCKGEAIRPRLKTESSVKSFYTATAPAPTAATRSPSTTRPVYNKSNAGGGTRRPPSGGQRYGGGTTQQPYQGDRATTADGAADQRPSAGRSAGNSGGGGGQAERGSGKFAHGGKSRGGGKGGASSGGDAAAQSQPKQNRGVESVPPPPLLESHFPALGGDKAAVSVVAKESVNTPSDNNKDDKKEEEANNGSVEVQEDGTSSQTSASSGDKVVAAAEAKKPVAGYAAALLKAAPPRPSTPPTPAKATPSRSSSSQPKKGNSKEQKGGKPMPRKAATALPVDDSSSAGERSAGDRSASSKADSEKSATVAAVAPAWGGGKTFADILKKKNDGGQAEAKAGADEASAQS